MMVFKRYFGISFQKKDTHIFEAIHLKFQELGFLMHLPNKKKGEKVISETDIFPGSPEKFL